MSEVRDHEDEANNASESGVKLSAEVAHAYRYPRYPPDKFCISGAVPDFPCAVRKVGRMYVLKEKIGHDGVPVLQCMVGPCWPMIFVTLGLIIGISLTIFLLFMPGEPVWLIVIPSLALAVVLVAYAFTACTDPGIQRITQIAGSSSWTYNEQAQTYRAPGAIYDLEAQVILQDIDHFCPWTGTVIAKGNLKAFYVFTASLMFLVVCVIGVAVYHFTAK
mmetsp:Transcript_17505/g.28332  ORF Transcript_17505/g.28332 Transcript_17505/m.28332 type:complete len:219 (-) Transcript_17505:998-1654(-)